MFHRMAVCAFHPLGSLTCNHVILSFAMAFCQSFFFSSSETLKISKPCDLNFEYSFTWSLLAALQGPHQLAQKSSNITFPLKDSSVIESPLTFGSFINTLGSEILGN